MEFFLTALSIPTLEWNGENGFGFGMLQRTYNCHLNNDITNSHSKHKLNSHHNLSQMCKFYMIFMITISESYCRTVVYYGLSHFVNIRNFISRCSCVSNKHFSTLKCVDQHNFDQIHTTLAEKPQYASTHKQIYLWTQHMRVFTLKMYSLELMEYNHWVYYSQNYIVCTTFSSCECILISCCQPKIFLCIIFTPNTIDTPDNNILPKNVQSVTIFWSSLPMIIRSYILSQSSILLYVYLILSIILKTFKNSCKIHIHFLVNLFTIQQQSHVPIM